MDNKVRVQLNESIEEIESVKCCIIIQNHTRCKKVAVKNLKKSQELKLKWAAKAGVVLVLMSIKS